jgi:3-hydroxyisobutyrate dehydrogenase-like beta-hydroxyacid dehydrogenase
MTDPRPTIGIFGLGLIGNAVAQRLHTAGFNLKGFDPDPTRRNAFAELGTPCEEQEVWQADIVFSCVFDTDQLAALIDSAPAGQCTLVSLSTCDPERMPDLADLAQAKDITLIEAPISGTSKALAEGNVLLMVAGDAKIAETLNPVFSPLCRQHLHVGAIGNGNRAKLAINLVLGLNRAALAEGMVFAETLGLASDDFLTIARASAAYSAVMDMKGDMMARRDFAPQGRIRQSAKDFALIREGAADKGQGLPFTETYLAMMHDAMTHDEGELDNSAVLLPIARSRPKR